MMLLWPRSPALGVAVDNSAPTPNPSTWATEPYAVGALSIKMTATTASDANGVQYYFKCVAGGGHDSGWQDSPTYQDNGLVADTSYSYQVQTRDKSSKQNIGGWSVNRTATAQKASTASALSSSANPVVYGRSLTFTATVTSTGGTRTGTVQFLIDGTPAGAPVALAANGKATYATTALNAGSHTISAEYSGNATLAASSGGLSQTVNPAALTVSTSAQSSIYGQVVPPLTGTLTGVMGSDGITAAYSTAATQFSDPGGYAITPTLNDPNNKLGNYTATINSGTLTISKASQTITWGTPDAIMYGTAIDGTQLNATVAGINGGSPPGALTYSPVEGTVLSGGNQTLTVTVAATTDYDEAVGSVTLTVNKVGTTTALGSNGSPSNGGQVVTFTATVTPVSGSGPSGTVQFRIDGVNAGSGGGGRC